MRKILSSRIFRILVCLVLICCILVNSSPIKAEAVVTEGLLAGSAWVPVASVAAAVIIALGVMAASDRTVFSDMVNNCVTWLTNTTSYVTNGMVNVLGLMSADGTVQSFIMKDMIQDIWQWLFSSYTVHAPTFGESVSAGFSATDKYGNVHLMQEACNVLYVREGSNYYQIFTADHSFSYRTFNASESKWFDCTCTTFANSGTGVKGYYHGILLPTPSDADKALFYNNSITSAVAYFWAGTLTFSGQGSLQADGLTLGQIQSPITGTDEEIIDIEIAPIYVDWNTGKVSQKPPGSNDDDEKIHLPLSIPSIGKDLSDAVIDMSQEVAQEGTPSPDLDFDFESSGDGTGDGSGDSTGDSSGSPGDSSGSWQPPKTPMTVDLTKFFPFCIPFDLFEFFKLLNAEPVAPVLHWEMHDLAGETYSLTIDLSEWDSVALLFRRLQLFLFITGLAAASRKFIKW